MTHTYPVSGMTCNGCAAKVSSLLSAVKGVDFAIASNENQSVEITMQQHIHLDRLKEALAGTKYSISEEKKSPPLISIPEGNLVSLKTYLPIFLIFGFITTVTLIIQFTHAAFNTEEWMRHFMAGFFLVFSFFKLLDVPAFAMSYSSYDIIAKKWLSYGYIYPFIELALGLGFLFPSLSFICNLITLIVMSISIKGVLQSVLNKRQIQCACLGAVFNLPMSSITIIEDSLMIVMSAAGLIMLQ